MASDLTLRDISKSNFWFFNLNISESPLKSASKKHLKSPERVDRNLIISIAQEKFQGCSVDISVLSPVSIASTPCPGGNPVFLPYTHTTPSHTLTSPYSLGGHGTWVGEAAGLNKVFTVCQCRQMLVISQISTGKTLKKSDGLLKDTVYLTLSLCFKYIIKHKLWAQ